MTRVVPLMSAGVGAWLLLAGSVLAVWGQERPPAAVIVSRILEQRVPTELSLVGTAQPRRSSTVASETEGLVVALLGEVGHQVRRGQVIVELGNDQLQAALTEARADVELHARNFEQNSELLRQEAVTEQSLRDTEYQLSRARAKLANLDSRLRALAIKAPFDGHVVQTFAQLGEWVDRGAGVARIIATDTIRVQVDVPERYVDLLSTGHAGRITVDALGSEPLAGRVVAILAEGHVDSRTFPVIVEALNPGNRIRSAMSARVIFELERAETVILVHKDAVVSSTTGQFVYVASSDTAAVRQVRTGMAYRGYVTVVEGELEPGELVVVRGNERLSDGQSIRVIRTQE
jgi:membrane fusion protein, multidrug efflux system